MKKYAIIAGVIAVAVVVALWITGVRVARAPSDGQMCTMEAKICPDGSAVGRTGPNCEFAECPSAPTGPISLDVRLGKEVSGLDVRITPLEVVADSRCPVDVTCIWAGTVKVRARLMSGLGEAMPEFELGKPITTEAEIVTLTEVLPPPKAGVKIKDSEYVFMFEVAKR